uniref:Pentatricopeptide repeat-containing protein n=1 Tax=Davidia involucrata TaxID=16924 RepID=A0A5B7C274_DAVIN
MILMFSSYPCVGLLNVAVKVGTTVRNCFGLAIEAFGRIGELIRAEELWLEMKSKKGLRSTEQFNVIIYVYCKHGFIIKQLGCIEKWRKMKPLVASICLQPNPIITDIISEVSHYPRRASSQI